VDIVPSPPPPLPPDITQILEKAIKNVLGVTHPSDEAIKVVWMTLVGEMPVSEAACILEWQPQQVRDVVQECKNLYLT